MNKSQAEILDITQEEASEVVVAISKIRRFGLTGVDPRTDTGETNQDHLEEEIGDLMAMIRLMELSGFIRLDKVNIAMEAKLNKLKLWSSIDRELLDYANH
jgi:NTP pyrophosphatase (non-canonical NTP hydrolase)